MAEDTRIDEVGDGIYRISTYCFDLLTFNQFLVLDDEPLLFHCGPRALFDAVSGAAATVVAPERLRWVTFGHFEADECGSMNQWLAAAPSAQVAHGLLGCLTSLNDQADREPRPLDHGEVIETGRHRLRHLDTPHVPHAWDARVLYDETTGTLFGGDLFTTRGRCAPTTEADLVEGAMAYEDLLPYSSLGPTTGATIRTLADLGPTTIALMHGPTFHGDGRAQLGALADAYEARRAGPAGG